LSSVLFVAREASACSLSLLSMFWSRSASITRKSTTVGDLLRRWGRG
jgi:hypothetical protein